MIERQQRTPVESSRGHQLRLPMQSAPIHRAQTGAALAGATGVDPALFGFDFDLEDVIDAATKYGPALAKRIL